MWCPGRYSPAGRLGFDARGSTQLSHNLALTLALAEGRSTFTRLNTTCRAFNIFDDVSVAIRWRPSEWNSSDCGSRKNGPPPREKFCDAPKDSKEVRSRGFALDHCSPRGLTSSGTGVLTKRRLVSDTPNPRAQTKPKTTRRAHFEKNRSRRAEERRLKFNEDAADASQGLTFLQRFKLRTPTQHAIDSRVADFLMWSGEPNLQSIPWNSWMHFWRSTWTYSSSEESWPCRSGQLSSPEESGAASSTLEAVHHLHTLQKPRHDGLPAVGAGLEEKFRIEIARVTSHTSSEASGVRDDRAMHSSHQVGDGSRPRGVVKCNAPSPQRFDHDADRPIDGAQWAELTETRLTTQSRNRCKLPLLPY